MVNRQSNLEINFGHLGVGRAIWTAFLPNRQLRVLQELERGRSRSLILHLIDSLFDEAEQVVDVLGVDKVVLLMVVEVEVRVEYFDEQVQIFWLSHAYLGRFEGLTELCHDLGALLPRIAEEEMGCVSNSLSLEIFLEELVGVADSVGAERLKVVRAEAR